MLFRSLLQLYSYILYKLLRFQELTPKWAAMRRSTMYENSAGHMAILNMWLLLPLGIRVGTWVEKFDQLYFARTGVYWVAGLSITAFLGLWWTNYSLIRSNRWQLWARQFRQFSLVARIAGSVVVFLLLFFCLFAPALYP